MGGSVALTIREQDGTEHRMSRWTNILQWICCDAGTFSKDPKHLKAVLKQWREMREDWAEFEARPDKSVSRDQYRFRFDMTDVYAPYTMLAPDGYGLVVLDMQKNVLLTMQGYTGFDSLYCRVDREMDPDGYGQVKGLFEAGRVRGWKILKGKAKEGDDPFYEIPLPDGCTWDQLVKLDKQYRKDRTIFIHGILIDRTPFTVEKFNEDQHGAIAFRQRLLDLGFKLSPEEEQQWAEWIADKRKIFEFPCY